MKTFMQEFGTEKLRDHIRDLTAKVDAISSATSALPFRHRLNSESCRDGRMFAPVDDDSQFRERRNKYSNEWQSRADQLVEQASEFLRIAHNKVQSAETAKCAAEAELKRYHDQVEKQIAIIMRETEEQMERSACRLAAVELQLAAAERRAATAEERANKAETSVRRLESALRTQAFSKKLNLVLTAA